MASRRWDAEDDAPKTKVTKENFRDSLKIFSFVQPYKWSYIIGLVLLFLSSVSFMVFPFMFGLMMDIAQGKSKVSLSLENAGLILVVVLAVQGFVSYARIMLFAKVSEKSIADVRLTLYRKLVSLPITFFEKSRVGELVSRLTSDVEKLYNTFSVTLAEFLRQIIILVCGLAFLAYTTPKLALIMIATFPIIVVGAIFFGRYIRQMSKDRQNQIAETNVILNETMQAINAVKGFTNEWFEVVRYGRANTRAVDISMKFASRRALFATFIVVVLFGALIFIFWEGVKMVQSDAISAGQLVTFFTYTAVIGGAIAGLGNFYSELVGTIGATERIRDILNMPSEVEVDDLPLKGNTRLNGDIEFRDVRFTYPTREDIEVLKGLSLKIKAGQKIALVGMSGAGKSTIAQLVLRFYKTTGGEILADGKNINDYNITDYRRNMAIVPQEVLLFGGTIRENIIYGKPGASDAEIIEAAKQSNSWQFISSFPEGLDTIVGERGVKLSGGQRQRIAIARAILRDPSILILDEATSSLDAESERLVQEALDRLMLGRTSIIIAHRLATIRDVDNIYVLDEGKIVEEGTHEELFGMEHGIYSGLARLQFESEVRSPKS